MSRDFSGYDRVEFGPFGHNGGVFPALVKYPRSQSSPDDVVLLWGSVAGVNYLADRAALGPFGFVQPLVDPTDSELRRSYRDQFHDATDERATTLYRRAERGDLRAWAIDCRAAVARPGRRDHALPRRGAEREPVRQRALNDGPADRPARGLAAPLMAA